MPLSVSKYWKFLAVVLILLMAVPCTVKKEIKQYLQIETRQSNLGVHKMACSSYFGFGQSDKVVKDQQNTGKHFSGVDDPLILFGFTKAPYLYSLRFQKAKTPVYILLKQLRV